MRAAFIGVTILPANANRAVADFRRQGPIKVKGGQIATSQVSGSSAFIREAIARASRRLTVNPFIFQLPATIGCGAFCHFDSTPDHDADSSAALPDNKDRAWVPGSRIH